MIFSVPEELSSDGQSTYTSQVTGKSCTGYHGHISLILPDCFQQGVTQASNTQGMDYHCRRQGKGQVKKQAGNHGKRSGTVVEAGPGPRQYAVRMEQANQIQGF